MPPKPLEPGDPLRLGRFELLTRLGEGGQGIVYLGRGTGPGEERVAVKVLRSSVDATVLQRLARELDVVHQVQPFVTARVIEASVEGGRRFVVSEFIDGPSLQERVAARGPLPEGDLQRLAVGTAAALTAIHSAGVVHRDFKPANVLLGPDGPRVVDFGIARLIDAATITSGLIGTPSYLAPEQLAGARPTSAVDIFAWAATMVFAGTGRTAFGADTVPVVMHRILYEEPELSGVPPPLLPVVRECLDKDPVRRPSARDLLLRLVDPAAQPATTIRTGPVSQDPPEAEPTLTAPVGQPEAEPARVAAGGQPRSRFLRRRGEDIELEQSLTFVEAAEGCIKTLRLADGKSVRKIGVRIPAGIADGQRVMFRGQGGQGVGDGQDGDLYVRVKVLPHQVFGRSGDNLTVSVPVTFPELVLGAEVKVPTLGGAPALLRIPAGIADGQRFRVPGKGIIRRDSRGSLLVTVFVTIPDLVINENRALLKQLQDALDTTAEQMRTKLIFEAGNTAPAQPVFSRSNDNSDAAVTVPVSFTELVLGADIKVPAPDHMPITLRIPPGTPHSRVFRVAELGYSSTDGSKGSLLIRVNMMVPDQINDSVRAVVEELRKVIGTGERMRAEVISQAKKSLSDNGGHDDLNRLAPRANN